MSKPVKSSKGITDQRKEKLLTLQKREQLKGMLINKFKSKYGNISSINQKVADFIQNQKLTEESLKLLDKAIKNEADDRPASQKSTKSHKSTKPEPPKETKKDPETASVKSYASSNIGDQPQEKVKEAAPIKDDDEMSVSSKGSKVSKISINENDEWAAIVKFNTDLNLEEIREEAERAKKQKEIMKQELDKQLIEKKEINHMSKTEEDAYIALNKQYLAMLAEKEANKQNDAHNKMLEQKKARDQQLHAESKRKKNIIHEEAMKDHETVQRLKKELEEEKHIAITRKKLEREHMTKMMEENTQAKKKSEEEALKEKDEDKKAQEQYALMLEKQEQDRLNQLKSREKKTQDIMNSMAGKVLQEKDKRMQDEEERIKQFELAKKVKEQKTEEAKARKLALQKKKMCDELARQVEEKKKRAEFENKMCKDQAMMWKRDVEDYYEEEKKVSEKIKDINKEHQSILMQQIAENKKRAMADKMNINEFLLNKKLLEQITDKKRTTPASPPKENLEDNLI